MRWLEQLFCQHEFIRQTDRPAGRLYTHCMYCLKESPGIYFAPTKIFKTQEESDVRI